MEDIRVETETFPKHWLQKRVLFSDFDQAFVDKIHDAEVRDDDVWLVTWPKSGTTWMQELLWLVINDYNFKEARSEDLELRSPYFEFDYTIHEDLDRAFESVNAIKSPRVIKSHLPLPLLPRQLLDKKPKIVYVFRNTKDVMVSLYYFLRNLGYCMDNTLEQFVLDFIDEKCVQTKTIFEHVTEFYALRKEPWIFYTSYECMKRNLRKVIEDICRFLSKNITEEQMDGMLHHLSFEEMKKNPRLQLRLTKEMIRAKSKAKNYDASSFIRRGLVNGHKHELSADVVAKMDQWMENNLAPYNLSLNELLLLNI